MSQLLREGSNFYKNTREAYQKQREIKKKACTKNISKIRNIRREKIKISYFRALLGTEGK